MESEFKRENSDEKTFSLTFTYAKSDRGQRISAKVGYIHQHRSDNLVSRRWFKAGITYDAHNGQTGIEGEFEYAQRISSRRNTSTKIQISIYYILINILI